MKENNYLGRAKGGLWMGGIGSWARNPHKLYHRKNEDKKEMKGFWRAVLAKSGSYVALRIEGVLGCDVINMKRRQIRFFGIKSRRSPRSSVAPGYPIYGTLVQV